MKLMHWVVVWLLCAAAPSAFAQEDAPASLRDLLERVRAEREADAKLNRERETRFLAERDERQDLLRQAQKDLADVKRASERKRATFEQNQGELEELRAQLDDRAASLGELFGVVRQVARDTAGVVEGSFVSAQYPGRTEFLSALSESTALASSEELERLWLVLLEEMIQSGQVVKFPATVLDPDGAESQRDIVRVGVFNAVSQGQYLRYLPETGQLAELPRQPERGFRSAAQDLEELNEGYAAFGVDPSRGAILAALVQAPDVWERIQQGGVVGYVILGVGLLALGLSVERGLYLWREGQRMEAQRVSGTLKSDNALGRVMMVYDRESVLALETLEARLDEAIIEQTPRLERGLSTLGILAAMAPLLGLLGTVIGMIQTFQSITLFGAGDPRIMSDGISQALVTTQLGLIVAIPIILLHTLLSNRSNRLLHVLEEQSAGMVSMMADRKEMEGIGA